MKHSEPLEILLACRSESRRKKVDAALESLGAAHVRLVLDTGAAVASLERTAFDLVVLDFHMQEFDAVEVLRAMRSRTISKLAPALLCLDTAAAWDRALAWNAHVTDLVIEPFESEMFVRALWRIPALARRLAARASHPETTVGDGSGARAGSVSGAAFRAALAIDPGMACSPSALHRTSMHLRAASDHVLLSCSPDSSARTGTRCAVDSTRD